MKCPNCKNELKKVQSESACKGLEINIDQCFVCGGIWFDQYELYQIPAKEAYKIDQLDKKAFDKETKIKDVLYCPKDEFKLVSLKDSNLPKKIDMERCNKCGGIWLNRGNFTAFKENIKKHRSKKISPEIEQLIKSQSISSEYVQLASRIVEVLMSPVNPLTGNIDDSDQYIKPYKLSNEQIINLKEAPIEQKNLMYAEFMRANKLELKYNQQQAINFANKIISILRVILFLIIR